MGTTRSLLSSTSLGSSTLSSAFGRVQVSSLAKGVLPDKQQTRYIIFITLSIKELYLELVTFFPASLNLQYFFYAVAQF